MIDKFLIVFIGHIPYRTHVLTIGRMEASYHWNRDPVAGFRICQWEKMSFECHMPPINTGRSDWVMAYNQDIPACRFLDDLFQTLSKLFLGKIAAIGIGSFRDIKGM